MYGYRCPECGAFLDPGERCDCAIEKEKAAELRREQDSKPKKRTSRKKRSCAKLKEKEGRKLW